MIAAAVTKTSPWWQNLSFSWFDVALIAILAFGYWRGRKRGMSREALPTAAWLVAIVAAGFGHLPLGEWLQQTGYVSQIFGKTFNQRTVAFVICYLAICALVLMIYLPLATKFREKTSGSNAFGGGEYYLGMISGIIRYACITLFFLALLNAPFYSAAEIAADKAYKNRWFGGGQKDFSGDFIPSIADIQAGVFQKSIAGQAIKNHLGSTLLISPYQNKKASDGVRR